MNKLFLYSTTILVVGFVTSCIKDTKNSVEPKAVVEAYLQPGQRTKVKVTKQIITGVSDSATRTIDGLNITILHNGIHYPLTQSLSGIYETTALPVIAGEDYELNFTYNNQVIKAATKVPDKPIHFTCSPGSITIPTFSSGGGLPSFPDPLTAKWNNSVNAYHYLLIKSVDSSASKIDNPTGQQAPAISNTPDQGNSKEINFVQFQYYGRHALILYRIQPELALLYNSVNSNSQNLSTVPTNVINGLGIFTAINIADTVFITVH